MRLIDANVFIYAVGRPHTYREPCRRLLLELETGTVRHNIDTELLQEILAVFWRQRRLADGIVLFDRVHRAFPDPLAITNEIIITARSILGQHARIAPRDAIHAAVVLRHGLEGIVSADRGFDSIAGVTRFDPMDL